ncbi:MAG: hypothetical protein JST91_03740 [Actinobacteria bacterium]|nr:hypothetical protein [Actinomycetota bacterium]
MKETPQSPHRGAAGWRDPLSLGFEAHRGLLLLRLRWHAASPPRLLRSTREDAPAKTQRRLRGGRRRET